MNKFREVFIVEDDIEDYHFLVEGLEQVLGGCETHHALDGVDALITLKSGSAKPDIIFIDLNIPLKNGIETLKLLKQDEEFQNIPVVVYAASHYLKDVHASYMEGAHYYLITPKVSEALVIALERLVFRLNKSLERPGKTCFVIGEKSLNKLDYSLEDIGC